MTATVQLSTPRDYALAVVHVSRALHVTTRVARILLEGIAHGDRTLSMDVTNQYPDLACDGTRVTVDIEPVMPEWAILRATGFTLTTTITRQDGYRAMYATTYTTTRVLPSGDTVRAYRAGEWN